MQTKRVTNRVLLAGLTAAVCLITISSVATARQTPKGKGHSEPQNFLRQPNHYSNIAFYFTNRGVLFNNDQVAGLLWPRGSSDHYIFGGGLWFATKKDIQGKKRKLCELGYNPNSGAGWYIEGEQGQLKAATDGATAAAKYISYVSPRYDKTSGKYLPGTSTVVPAPYYSWPLWDTSATKSLKHNFYFGDYISDVTSRNHDVLKKNGKQALPAIISEEDIANFYTDADPTNNPEYKPNTGYPFGLDIQEVIYSWSFGRYRDMIFVRHRVTNTSADTLYDCWIAPAFDPDLGDPNNDRNTYVSDSVGLKDAGIAKLREPYLSHPSKLNMGYQSSQTESGHEYGQIGFSFLESPVVNSAGQLIANDDSAGLGGYGPNSLFQTNALGLKTFNKWTIANDPSTQDLRYDFVSSGSLTLDNGVVGDMRLLFATGPFTMLPGKYVETTIAIGIARPSLTNPAQNFQALLSLMDFAHQVFGEPDSVGFNTGDSTGEYVINHFLSPVPPDIPNIQTQSLDRAVLVTWDSTAERSVDPVSQDTNSLPFMGYQLWRSTRADRDSTIRPQGVSPDVMLGQWQLYDLRADSNFDSKGHFRGFRYTRTNKTPHPIPHSYLDVGDDNHDGILTGNEGLINGVKYYYYLVAFDEYDSLNHIGPLFTAVVPPKNVVQEIPAKPPFLTTINDLGKSDFGGNCQAGGIKNIRLDIVDTGRFLQLYTNDQICVSMQPRWVEQADQYLGYSNMFEWVDVSDTRNGLNNTYQGLHNPTGTPATEAYYVFSGIRMHIPGTISNDSTVPTQFTTDNNAFAPNQLIDQTFRVLIDFTFKQDSTPYVVNSVKVAGNGDPSIIRLSRRTNNGKFDQSDLANLNTAGTRPSFLGALGDASYELTFDPPVDGGMDISNSDGSITFHPQVLPIHLRMADCPASELRHVQDTARDEVEEFDWRYYSHVGLSTTGLPAPAQDDPDKMYVPNPGWFAMDAWHFIDNAPLSAHHDNASVLPVTTWGPVYWSMKAPGNEVNGSSHLVIHRLRLAGGEFLFNAPGIPGQGTLTGDTLVNDQGPHNDFQAGDKITFNFTGIAKDIPFPGTCFQINTPSGDQVSFANAQLYKGAILDQVGVVPNPYIVTQEGQTSTDNAKLYFTRLPPRATIEIYAIDGTLINTLEHRGYASTTSQLANDPSQTQTTYDYHNLSDRSTVEEWNLLTAGKQRVGSQVLIARIIAKDANNGDAVIGETTTKFAVVIGGTHHQ